MLDERFIIVRQWAECTLKYRLHDGGREIVGEGLTRAEVAAYGWDSLLGDEFFKFYNETDDLPDGYEGEGVYYWNGAEWEVALLDADLKAFADGGEWPGVNEGAQDWAIYVLRVPGLVNREEAVNA